MDIIVYTKNGCPLCSALKNMLDSKKIEYTQNTNIDEMIALGFTSLPRLSVNGQIMTYKEAIEWLKEF